MKVELEHLRRELFEYGWINCALLLLALSLLPFLLPMADAIPKPTTPSEMGVSARAHNRVVLMIVDGLGYRRAVDPSLMPHLSARLRVSAAGTALASFPTITPSGLRAIIAGHRTASEPQMPTGIRTSSESDSILARAAKAGLNCFVVGQFSWEPLFPSAHGAQLTTIAHGGIEVRYDHDKIEDMSRYDEEVLRAAEPVVSGQRGRWDLLVLHLFESDVIGHALGTATGVYPAHLRWLDQRIEQFSRRVEESGPTTFLLLADHGQADDGTHGGLTNVERQVPFVLWGAGVKPGKLGTFPLYDAAPTVAALLGVPPPALTEGWPRLEAMQLTARQRADILRDLFEQRLGRWAAVKEAFPWILGDPSQRRTEFEALYAAKKFDAAAAMCENSIRTLDKTMDDALPAKWLWRVVAAVWALVLASCFGLAWSRAEVETVKLTAMLSATCLLLLLFPILRPSYWALASSFVLAASAGVAVLAILHGLRSVSDLSRLEWSLLWLALLGIAFQEVLDAALWSWFVVMGLFVSRCLHLNRQNAATTAVSFAAVLACALLSSTVPSGETSLVRAVLPGPPWPALGHPHWEAVSGALFGAWVVGSYFPLARFNEDPRSGLIYALATAPVVSAVLLMRLLPSYAALSWAASALSLAGLVYLRPSPAVRGMWLSSIALAYYCTLSDARQWCFLVLAVIVGWALAWKSRDAHPLWEGLGLLGIGLWSYKLSGSQLSFSHITVSEGYRVLGAGWRPYALLVVLTLKPLAVIGAPILPRLSIRPLYSVLGILPLLGALTGGNLTMLWWGRFMVGNTQKLTDTAEFAQTEFVLILAWLVLGLWAAVRALDLISQRVRVKSS